MTSLLPEAAYGMGFPARLIMVYSGTAVKVSPFYNTKKHTALRDSLVSDLLTISEMSGPFGITEEAQAAIEHWHLHLSDLDKPTHGRLVHYCTRRIMHLLKLCMVGSVSESCAQIVELRHVEWAKEVLFEAEREMPNVFRAMTIGSQEQLYEDAMTWVALAAGDGPISHQRLTTYWSTRVPSHAIVSMVDTMVSSGMLKRTSKTQKDGTIAHSYTLAEWSKIE